MSKKNKFGSAQATVCLFFFPSVQLKMCFQITVPLLLRDNFWVCNIIYFGVSRKTITQTVNMWKKKKASRIAWRINLHPLIGKSKASPPLEFAFVLFFFFFASRLINYGEPPSDVPFPLILKVILWSSCDPKVIARVQTDLHSLWRATAAALKVFLVAHKWATELSWDQHFAEAPRRWWEWMCTWWKQLRYSHREWVCCG